MAEKYVPEEIMAEAERMQEIVGGKGETEDYLKAAKIIEQESTDASAVEKKDSKIVIMPGKEEIISRLSEVESDPYMQERLFPVIANQLAGKELVGMGVVIGIELAFYDFAEGMPPAIAGLLHMNIKKYVEALVDDEEIKTEAYKMIDEVNDSLKADKE